MDNFEISDYLEQFNKVNRKGICKNCLLPVSWSRERVAAHKRSNCSSLSAEERCFFKKRKISDVSTSSLNTSITTNMNNIITGFFVDNDRIDIFGQIRKFVNSRYPGLGDKAEEEAFKFVSDMKMLSGSRKETVFKTNAINYWNICGRHEYPTLHLCAKSVNYMICSSAASERVWSIYRFIHSQLRNRLSNEKVQKLVFQYVNCAILDEEDQMDYILEDGAFLSGIDCQEEN